MDSTLLFIFSFAAGAISVVAYLLFTGLGPFTRRHWTDRVWRVTAAAACAYIAALFFFGDS